MTLMGEQIEPILKPILIQQPPIPLYQGISI
jgi:hypothetical protein